VTTAAERIFTQRELNRALLARQMLLERARLALPEALERMGGVQAQYAPSMYIGLWTRVEGFERDDLTRALERREVVQATLMRSTIHLVSARDYWLFAAGTREARREQWLRAYRGQVTERDGADAARRLRAHLPDGGTLRRKALDELLGRPLASGAGLWLDLVRVPPSGTWERRRADLYGAAEDWVGASDASPSEGVEHLVRRYLRGFGPAPAADIANWSGLSVDDVTAALAAMDLCRFRDGDGRELVDVPGAPLPDPDTPAPVRFLPTWDASLLVHARRTGVLPEQRRAQVFNTKMPQSVGTFLVDGAVAGTWRYGQPRVSIEPFARLGAATRRALDEEAERLAALHR
jgi:hypothetical protein